MRQGTVKRRTESNSKLEQRLAAETPDIGADTAPAGDQEETSFILGLGEIPEDVFFGTPDGWYHQPITSVSARILA